jgi:AcrR family transcriptional regulator
MTTQGTVMDGRTGGARRQRHTARERRVEAVATVLELAAEGSPGEITTAAIADRMGLTQGALFRHFATKEAVWEAVMEWVSGQLLGRLAAAVAEAEGRGALAVLEAMFLAHVDFIVRHPGVPRMLFGEIQRPDDSAPKQLVRALMERYRKRLAEWIRRGRDSGEIAAEVDPAAAATLFIGIIQGLVLQSLVAGESARMRRQAPQAFALYKRGIQA